MQATCPTCGSAMVPMILSSFCPRDCDRKQSPSPTSTPPRYTGTVVIHGDIFDVYHLPEQGGVPPKDWEFASWATNDGDRFDRWWERAHVERRFTEHNRQTFEGGPSVSPSHHAAFAVRGRP